MHTRNEYSSIMGFRISSLKIQGFHGQVLLEVAYMFLLILSYHYKNRDTHWLYGLLSAPLQGEREEHAEAGGLTFGAGCLSQYTYMYMVLF